MAELGDLVEQCLERIERGELTLQECLARHPEEAGALRAMIEEALDLRYGSANAPSPDQRARIRARLSRHMVEHPRGRLVGSERLLPLPALRWGLAAALAGALALGAATWAAQAAGPNSPLYGLKRLTERVRGELVGREADHQLWLAERRMEEWMSLQGAEPEAEVARGSYRRALLELRESLGPELPPSIAEALSEQQGRLTEQGLDEPLLDEMIASETVPAPTSTAIPPQPTPIPPAGEDPELELPATDPVELEELVPTPPIIDLLP